MQVQPYTSLTQPAELPGAHPSPGSTAPRLPSDLTAYSWRTMAQSIALAGGAYALFLAAIPYWFTLLLIGFAQLGAGSSGIAERALMFAMTLLWSVIQLFFYALAGIAWAGIVSLVALPLVYLVVWSLRIRGSMIWHGAFCGGLVGFLASLPFVALGAAAASSNP